MMRLDFCSNICMGIIQFVSYNQPHLQGYKDDRTYLGLTVALKKHAIWHKPKEKALMRNAFTQRM